MLCKNLFFAATVAACFMFSFCSIKGQDNGENGQNAPGPDKEPAITLSLGNEKITKTTVEEKITETILFVTKVIKEKHDVSDFSKDERAFMQSVLPGLKGAKTWLRSYKKWKNVIDPADFSDWCIQTDTACDNIHTIFEDIRKGEIRRQYARIDTRNA